MAAVTEIRGLMSGPSSVSHFLPHRFSLEPSVWTVVCRNILEARNRIVLRPQRDTCGELALELERRYCVVRGPLKIGVMG